MKKIFTLSLTLLVAITAVLYQATQKQPLAQSESLNKSKKQKKTARTLLIGGGILISSSFLVPRGKLVYDGICFGVWCDDDYKNDGIKSALFIAGGLSALGSIPFSIASSKNRKKAKVATTFIDLEKYPALNALLIHSQSFPVVGLKVSL